MKTLGLYTFWVSFIMGNIFMFGFLFGVSIRNSNLAFDMAISGLGYAFLAAVVNFFIMLVLLTNGITNKKERKDSFIGIGIMLLNFPIATLYVFVGLWLLEFFNIF